MVARVTSVAFLMRILIASERNMTPTLRALTPISGQCLSSFALAAAPAEDMIDS